MLHRQRAILFLLAKSGGSLSQMRLTRLLYCVREMTENCGGRSFYDFLTANQARPRSFVLEFEIEKLSGAGLLERSGRDSLSITGSGLVECGPTPTWLQRDIRSILDSPFAQSPRSRDDHAGTSSAAIRPIGPQQAPATDSRNPRFLYTAGYESLSVDAFLAGLLRARVERLIDVRRNAISRRYGFHGRTLARLCGEVGIDYAHFPRLGIASNERRSLESQVDYDKLFKSYRTTTLRQETLDLGHVVDLAKARPSALLCAERNPAQCHRTHLAREVCESSGLRLVDLDLLSVLGRADTICP